MPPVEKPGVCVPSAQSANAIDVLRFVLIIGAVIARDAIDAGTKRTMTRLKGRDVWINPFGMALFALGGTTCGVAKEKLALDLIATPVMIAAGYVALVAVAVILLCAGVGVPRSTITAFSTVIASDAAGVTFAKGLRLRITILVVSWPVTVAFVMRYAAWVKADLSKSPRFDRKATNEAHFRKDTTADAAFTVKIWGVSPGG